MTRSFDVFFDLRLSKQSGGWWFETLSRPLWRHCNGCPWRETFNALFLLVPQGYGWDLTVLSLGYVSYVNLVSAVVMSTYIIIFINGHSIEYGIGKFIFSLNLNFDIMLVTNLEEWYKIQFRNYVPSNNQYRKSHPANTKRNKHVIIRSKRRLHVIITCLLRCVFARYPLSCWCYFMKLEIYICIICNFLWNGASIWNHSLWNARKNPFPASAIPLCRQGIGQILLDYSNFSTRPVNNR